MTSPAQPHTSFVCGKGKKCERIHSNNLLLTSTYLIKFVCCAKIFSIMTATLSSCLSRRNFTTLLLLFCFLSLATKGFADADNTPLLCRMADGVTELETVSSSNTRIVAVGKSNSTSVYDLQSHVCTDILM